MRERFNKISGLILLLLFVFYYAGSNLFPHIHTIDGVKVVHSHPYSHGEHHHSRGVVEILSHSAFTFVGGVVLPLLVLILCGVVISVYRQFKSSEVNYSLHPRAPPVFS